MNRRFYGCSSGSAGGCLKTIWTCAISSKEVLGTQDVDLNDGYQLGCG